ncbi:MAG: Holliday junction branch migration protein RuvA [Anaerovoracaceae bacterium]
MLRYIKGILVGKLKNAIIVDVNGVGIEIFVSGNSSFYLKNEDEEVKVFTEMIVREDSLTIYGFDDVASLELFKQLITVNGVGAKAAIAIFSSLTQTEIRKAIIFDDTDILTKANGIGKKTAQRIILDLKDKIGDLSEGNLIAPQSTGNANNFADNKSEAIAALMELGYARAEATTLVENIAGEDLSVEDYIRSALRKV